MDWMSELKKRSNSLYGMGNYLESGLIDDIIDEYGWHPVSEPPEKDGWYFVTLEENSCYSTEVALMQYNPLRNSGDHWAIDGVIAWMPLPEPYQLKETSDDQN